MSIATVVSISGQAWARDADGNMRELRVGDTLAEGESLVTSDNGRVELDFADNLEPAVIEGGQVVVMTPDLDANQPVDAGEFSALDEDLEALLAALDDDDIDLLDVLDPTAAGAGPGGGADGGHSFVQLARIAENIDPLAFEFGMGEFDGPPEIEGGDLLLAEAEEADVDVVIPDPTVSITAFEIGSSNNEVGSILTGTATNASTVTVTLTGPNGTITFEVEVDAEGNWSVDLSGQNLPEGSYTVEAIASNQQGTRSEPATAESGYTLPTVEITTFEIGSEGNDVSTALTGTAGNATHVNVTLTGPNGLVVTFEVAVVNGAWSVDLSGLDLPAGEYSVQATARDAQNNTSAPDGADSGYTLPTVEIATFEIGSEGNEVSTALTGTAGNATHVNVTLTGPNGLVETFEVAVVNGAWSVDLSGLDLPAGEYSVEATARDAQNNTSAPDGADSGYTLPTVEIATFEIGSEGNEVSTALTGTAGNATHVNVTLTGPNGLVETFEVAVVNGAWSVDLSGLDLPAGEYSVQATARDAQNNISAPDGADSGYTLPTVEIATFEIGSEGNEVSTALTGSAGNATHVNVTLTGPNGLVETFEVAVVDGVWSVDLSDLDLPAGEYSVEATARDAQNNTSAPAEADSGYTLPSILGLSDSDITVNEQYLEGGTAAGEGEPSASGQFTLVSPGGVGAIFVVGTLSEGGALQDGDKVKLSQADLEGLSLDNPVVIETPQGNTLILTGYDATTGEVSYTFELGSAVEHEAGEGRNELAKDGIQIELMDGLGNTANGTVDVTIIDDIPESFANVQAIEVPISEVIVGNWAAGWVNVKTTNGQYNGEDLDSDDFKDFISWGARAGGSQGSNYVFEDNEDLRDLDTGKVDQTFVLGKFTHNNFPIFFNEGTLESVDLTMEFTILIDGVETQVTHTINIKHEETPNNTGTPEGDADIVTIYNAATIVRIEVGDREFEFEILGFKRVGEPDSDPVTQVITFENASNTFELIGRISSTDDLPVLTGQIEDPFWGADGPDDEEPVLWSTDSGEQAVAEGGTLTIEGQYGTLIVSADGRYIYEVSRETRDNMNIGEDKKDVFTYYLQDADGDRVQSTLTINLAGVANPVDPDSIGEPEVQVALEGPADLVLKVDNSNAQAKPEGFEVSAYYYHQPGAASQSGRWEKGEISKAEGRGFGVDRAGPDGSGAAKSEIANGQRLEVRFDQDVSEASFQLAWLSDSEYAKYTLHYDDGTSSSTIVKGDTPEGGFDGIGAVITVSPPDGKKISGIDFDTPAIGETGYGVGNDYVVHQISYKAAELYAIVVDVTLADDNVSEEVVSVVLAGVPAGATLSAGEDNGDGSWTLPLDGSGDYKVELTNGKLTISGLTLQVPLDHQGPVEVDAMVTVQGGDSLAIIGGLYDETLVGGEGDDLLVGGAGNDILTGGLGDDVFKWNFGDQGTSENAAFDIVTDFGEGDNTLHIADLLQEESQGSINDFILAKEEGDDLVLYIKHDGAESAIDSDGSNADQIIKLEGKSFGSWQDGEGQVFGNGEDLIQHLIETGQIHIDQ